MSTDERKMLLWEFLDIEINESQTMEQGLIIQLDANAHLGLDFIKGDPNPRNSNGTLMYEFLERNPAITVVNSLKLCKGLITRRRETIKGVEEAVLDFFLVNEKNVAIFDKYDS